MAIFFLDTERDQNNKIIQLGVAAFNDEGEQIGNFKRNINTKAVLTSHIEALTGITTASLKKERTAKEVNKEFELFIQKFQKGKEKIPTFCWGEDAKYMNMYYADLGIENKKLNIGNIQKEVTNNILGSTKQRMSLKNACVAVGVEFEQIHDALDDAIKTGVVYFKSKDENGERYITLDMIERAETIGGTGKIGKLSKTLKECQNIAKKLNHRRIRTKEKIEEQEEKYIEHLSSIICSYAKEKNKEEKYKKIAIIWNKYENLLVYYRFKSKLYNKRKKEIEKMRNEITQVYQDYGKKVFIDSKESREELRAIIRLKNISEEMDSLLISIIDEEDWEKYKNEYNSLEKMMLKV